MTHIKIVFAVSALGLFSAVVAAGGPQSAVLKVDGMTCSSCPVIVKKVLTNTVGVTDAMVDYKTREAQIHFDPDRVKAGDLAKALTDSGFPSTVKK